MSGFVINISTPYVTVKKYAELVGITEASARKKVSLGQVPTVKQGKNRLINMMKLSCEAMEAA